MINHLQHHHQQRLSQCDDQWTPAHVRGSAPIIIIRSLKQERDSYKSWLQHPVVHILTIVLRVDFSHI